MEKTLEFSHREFFCTHLSFPYFSVSPIVFEEHDFT